MKRAKIIIHKIDVDKVIDASTFKRTDASAVQSEQQHNAMSSDTEESLDGFLVTEYRDRLDARLRERLRFCLVHEEGDLVYESTPSIEPDYIYNLRVDDSVCLDDIKSVGTKIKEYFSRGVLRDWYLYMNVEPHDNQQTLDELLDGIASALRGKSYGRRPVQPFLPYENSY